MRRTWIKPAAAGILSLLLAGGAPGQSGAPPAEAPAKSRLEEMLAQALRTNPDVRVAAAKVSEAEAELNRVRLQVVQKVVQAYQAVEAAQAMADYRAKEYQRVKQLGEQGAVTEQIVSEKEKLLAAAKAALAAAEADLSYLLGKQPAGTGRSAASALSLQDLADLAEADGAVRQWMYIPNVRREAASAGPAADKVRKALERSISIKVQDVPVKKLLETVMEAVPDVHIQVPPLDEHRNIKVSLQRDSISVAAVLELVEDLLTDYRFVVRDYGLLLARADHLPPGAPLLHEFRKGAVGPSSAKNPPAENVEGLIKQIDPASGLVTISLGSDAGLAKGQTLEVFRTEKGASSAAYLGTIRIVEVKASQAVGQPTGRTKAPLQVGDRVASRLK